MLIAQQGKVSIFHADDLYELTGWLAATPALWRSRNSETNRALPEWDLGVGYAGALKLARDGWSEGARNVEFSDAQPLAAAMLKTKVLDFAGELPDIGRYVSGEPMHMTSHRRKERPIVHLVVNLWASGGTSARTFTTYGRALLALVDQLESGGHRVELDVVFPTAPKGHVVCAGWKVKRAADALDPAALAFSIAHPAAMRRLGFAMVERAPLAADDGGAYGYQTELTDWMVQTLDFGNAIILPGVGIANRYSAQQTNATLRKNVAKAGLTVEMEA